MGKILVLHQEGIVSVAQMPHETGGFTHILAKPHHRSILYYICHRPNRRTKAFTVRAGGFRSLTKAFTVFYKELKTGSPEWPSWDPMGKRVQKWEYQYIDPFFAKERLTKDQMLALLYRVCGTRKVSAPTVIWIKNANFCYFKRCEESTPYMVMSSGAELSNTGFVLHEMAHFLADLVSPGIDNHGPLFMKEYLGLLRDFTDLDLNVLRDGCREHKIRYWNPT